MPPIVWVPVAIGAIVTLCMKLATGTTNVLVIGFFFATVTVVAAVILVGAGVGG
jgi:hypothetical protein